jgi:sugar phosphate isomerase/epimerase
VPDSLSRREFLSRASGAAAGAVLAGCLPQPAAAAAVQAPFKISLAQWSLHRTLRSGQLDHLDFARTARRDFGLEAVEYVNTFFKSRATDAGYLAEMNRRAADHGVYQHLIMIDAEGRLGDPDPAARAKAITNHHRWVDAAATLGCASIRVNAESEGTYEEQMARAADGLRRLTEYGAERNINVIVENHGGLSSNGQWLAGVMKTVNHPRCGTLPDFGNFYEYDRYRGVEDLMPFAKAVSAKSYDFDARGEETTLDFRRFLRIVAAAGFRSWVGVEYEGNRLSEREGITRTKALLERIRGEMARG